MKVMIIISINTDGRRKLKPSAGEYLTFFYPSAE